MIGYSNSSQFYNIYNETNYQFIGVHQLNESVSKFDGAKNKGLIVFTTVRGNFGYIY